MKNKILIISLLILTVLVFNIANAEATRTAVIGFGSEDSSWIVDKDKEQEILEEIAWQFNDKLVNVEGYSVLSRDRMLDILDDTNYVRGQRPSRSVINRLRDYSNAEVFIYGRLENVDVEKKEVFKLGPIVQNEIEISVELSIDMISAKTGRITKTFNGRGREVLNNLNVIDLDNVGTGLYQEADKDILYKTIRSAVNDLIKNIETEVAVDNTREESAEAEILSIVQNKIIINKGIRDGLEIGQVGDLIRYRSTDSGTALVIVGEAKVVDIDQNSAFLESVYLNQKVTLDDKFAYNIKVDTSEDKQTVSPINELNTRDFVITITNVVKSGNRATILGTAYAKNHNKELELIMSNRDFYDHNGNRKDMTGKRVSIGAWMNSSSNIATIKDSFKKGETKNISWSFTGVSKEADAISRVQLWLKTQNEGEISINLTDINF
ncbi:MAG: hypothetical protein U5K53_01965 [Halanaerobiales bacterium]|nr:hypothetical protein [Halanaerobiales bacterium]